MALTAASALYVVPQAAAAGEDDGTVDSVRVDVLRVTPAGEFGLETPTGLAFDPGRNVLIVGDADGAVAEIEPDGVRVGTLPARAPGSVDDLAFDRRSRRLRSAAGGPGSRSVTWDGTRDRLVTLVDQGPRGEAVLETAGAESVPVTADHGADGPTLVAHDPLTDQFYTYDETSSTFVSQDETNRTVVSLAKAELAGPVEDAVFAPTADPTDDSAATSLFVTDGANLVELTLATAEVVTSAAAVEVGAVLVNTVELWQLDPPSPDSAGITYLDPTGNLLVADSEVNEMPLFEGVNLFELSGTANGGVPAFSLVGTGDTTPWSAEPTGVGYDRVSGHLFSSNDDADEVFRVVDGGDGQFGTGDDTVTSFDTRQFGGTDPEGVAVDTLRNDVLIVDGVGREVYRVDPGPNGVFQGNNDDVVTSFDVLIHGADDPEGIAYNHLDDTILVLDHKTEAVYEVSPAGSLLRTIDISSANTDQAAGLTLAPASDGSGAWHMYVVERGVDNNADPNENDGRLYEFAVGFGPTSNVAPVAEDDSATTNVDVAVVIDVVANDTDANGNLDPSSVVVRSGPGSGSAEPGGDGTVTYTPLPGTSGNDTFVYEVCDTDGLCDTGTVTVTVVAPVPPDAIDDTASTQVDTPVVVDVVANDIAGSSPIDPSTVRVSTPPVQGSAVPIGDGRVSYDPAPGFVGDESFGYEVCDGAGGCDTAVVTVTVLAGSPVTVQSRVGASSDDAEERAGGGVALTSSDLELVYDRSDQTVGMRFTAVDVPAGAAIVSAHVQFTTDEASTVPTDLVVEGQLSSDPSTFTTANGDVSSRPRTAASVSWAPAGWPSPGQAGPAQRTPDLSSIVQEITGQPGWSAGNSMALIVTGSGERVAESYNGSAGDAPLLVISYLVDTGPQPPSAADDSATTMVETPVVVDVVANDSDPNGDLDPSTVRITSAPPGGTADASAGDGTVTYTPRAGTVGADSFDYEVCDSAGACDVATVSVTVLAPQAPDAVDDAVTTQTGASVVVSVLDNDVRGTAALDPASVEVTAGPGDGQADTSAGDGTVTYTPDPAFVGDDSFTYRVCDTDGLCDTAVVAVSVLAGEPTTVQSRVSAGDDDAEERATGRVALTSSDLELVFDRDDQIVGMRFLGVDVPAGAAITDAYVQFTTDEVSSGAVSLLVRGQRSSNPATFDSVDGNVSSRPRTAASVAWSPAAWSVRGAAGPEQRTPDLSAVIQEIIDLPGWAQGNPVAVVVSGTGERVAESYNGSPTDAPLLVISYLLDAGPRPPTAADDSATTAIETPVTIDVVANDTDVNGDLDPSSVTVTSEPTNGGADTTASDGTVRYSPNSSFDGTDTFTYQICDTGGLCDTATVTVTVVAPEPPVAADDSSSTTVDTPVVIDVVANDTDADGDLDPSSVRVVGPPSNGDTSTAAANGTVTYTPLATFSGADVFTYEVCDLTLRCDTADVSVTVAAGAPTTIEVRVSASSDDAEERAGGAVSLTSSDLELVFDRDDQTVGMRFAAVDLPIGAVVTDAWIQFTVDETSSGATSLSFRGQRSPDAPTFVSSSGNVSTRTRTSASVGWSPPAWTVRGAAGAGQRTPDLSTVVQEVVDQPGWASGNAIVIIVTGSGERVAESFNGESASAPLLHVEYVFDSGPRPPVAADDSASTFGDAVVIDVIANDSDVNGDLDPSSVVVVSGPSNGSAVPAADGSITYTPGPSFEGVDTFDYRVCDLAGACDTATVSVTVGSAANNEAPVVDAGADQTLTLQDDALLLGTWSDDGVPYEAELVEMAWSVVSGAGPVVFAEDDEALTTASFSAVGTYVLRLTGDDGLASSSDDLVVTITESAADTLRVPQQYPTIQDAIDAASDHDLVLVDRGTYSETLNISKTITLASTYYTTGDPSAIDETVIASPDILEETVTFGSGARAEARIIGFTVRDGKDGVKIRGTASVLDNRLIDLDTDAVDFSEDGRGWVSSNVMENNGDDGVDIDTAQVLIQGNTMRANQGDAVEIRTINQTGRVLTITIRDNHMVANLQDGIQLIDDDTIAETNALLRIDRNHIEDGLEAGFGLMDNGTTTEDYRAASLLETIVVTHNTFVGNDHGITGGDRMVVANNLVTGHANIGLKGVDGASVVPYNLLWANGTDHSASNVDVSSSVFADPLLTADDRLGAGSPAIDAGVAELTLPSGYVLTITEPSEFAGAAPDLGAFESG